MSSPLETRTLGEFLDQLAAKTPTPGGGAVASAVGALAAALGGMVLAYSVGKKSLAEHDARLTDAAARLERARAVMLELAAEDEAAYGLVNELSRLPEGDGRREALPEATLMAARVPLSCVAACVSVLALLDELPGITNRHLRSDLAIAAILGEAAARSAAWNVAVNLPGIADAGVRAEISAECEGLLGRAAELAGRVEGACRG
jgi:formiminotetrahydrofolate cyclodeaminase